MLKLKSKGAMTVQPDLIAQATRRQNMRAIPPGAKGSFALVVAPEHLASRFKDAILPPVLATPIMVLVMENAALNAIRDFLEPGESALGTVVDVRHLAATPVGQRVTAEAEVTHVEGRRIVFAVTARDEVEEIGRGTHERTVIDLRRLTQRLDAKAGRQRRD
ncbi:thioesterase family protein [Bradyrhizobium ivorense]|uniref:thioesterase family protein n=2 Tax=Bradyrhizobium ivorense TaxID=2511166 RepID=UPI001FCF280A|nr:thioesterase family protein [Bradyrhizobium ivorense]